MNYTFDIVDDYLRMPYEVIDLQRTELTSLNELNTILRATVCMTLNVPQSYSNLMLTYEVILDLKKNRAVFRPTSQFDSSKLNNRDTFKVSKIYSIPESSIAFVVDRLYGVYILDLIELRILKEIDIWSDNEF